MCRVGIALQVGSSGDQQLEQMPEHNQVDERIPNISYDPLKLGKPSARDSMMANLLRFLSTPPQLQLSRAAS
jgi:hypothetical protein